MAHAPCNRLAHKIAQAESVFFIPNGGTWHHKTQTYRKNSKDQTRSRLPKASRSEETVELTANAMTTSQRKRYLFHTPHTDYAYIQYANHREATRPWSNLFDIMQSIKNPTTIFRSFTDFSSSDENGVLAAHFSPCRCQLLILFVESIVVESRAIAIHARRFGIRYRPLGSEFEISHPIVYA